MKYNKITHGRFLKRPNRFIAHVEIDGQEEIVHVKNTGRCKELLVPQAHVILEVSDNPNRKTRCDLVAVYKAKNPAESYAAGSDRCGTNDYAAVDRWRRTDDDGYFLINMDSQAPNKVVREWLAKQDFDVVKPEFTYGDSRIDFYMERGDDRYLMEVKGCTLEVDGVGYFPDAPTERGIKHLRELAKAASQGYKCIACFVIQMEGVDTVLPNVETHPQFGVALQDAKEAGVQVLCLKCKVTESGLEISEENEKII